ncbi:MAG: UbiA family prenyltransferase [Mycobacteriales bacterium]
MSVATNHRIAGVRLRVLALAIAPVLAGSGAAAAIGPVSWWRLAFALVVAVSVQLGAHAPRPYSLVAFGVTGAAGLVLAAATTWWLVPLGAAGVLAAWTYHHGPWPYGGKALGEVALLVFSGFVATAGTAYVGAGRLTRLAEGVSLPVGLMAVAALIAKNLRDLPIDAAAGRRTLAVALGDALNRTFYLGCVLAVGLATAAVSISRPGAMLGLASGPLLLAPIRSVVTGQSGMALSRVVTGTTQAAVLYAALLGLGLAL